MPNLLIAPMICGILILFSEVIEPKLMVWLEKNNKKVYNKIYS